MSQYVRWCTDNIFNVGNRLIALEIEVVKTIADSGAAMSGAVIAIYPKAIFYCGEDMGREILSRAKPSMKKEQGFTGM